MRNEERDLGMLRQNGNHKFGDQGEYRLWSAVVASCISAAFCRWDRTL